MARSIARDITRLGALLGVLLGAAALTGCGDEPLTRLLRKAEKVQRFWRRTTPALAPARPDDPRPNVILVSMDTVRADSLGCYGSPRAEATPHLDRFAAEGTRMARSWSQAPSTTLTHASMFTGARIYEHGTIDHTRRLTKKWTTLAEHMLAEGYHTVALTTSMRFRLDVKLDQGFHVYERYDAPDTTDRSAAAVEQLADEMGHSPERPVFAFVHLMDAHAPYAPPEPWLGRYLDGEPAVDPATTVDFIRTWRRGPDTVSAAQKHDMRALYDGGVSFVDHRIGQIREIVDATERPTIVLLTSDHGEAFGDNGWVGHSHMLWDDLTRVPWIVWGPGVPAGQVIEDPVVTIDVMPTLAALADTPLAHEVTGRDLSAAVRGTAPVPPRDLVLQSTRYWGVVHQADSGLYKLVIDVKEGNRPQLYRLELPGVPESQAPVDDPVLAAAILADTLSGRDLTRVSDRGKGRTRKVSEDELEQLRALGYLD